MFKCKDYNLDNLVSVCKYLKCKKSHDFSNESILHQCLLYKYHSSPSQWSIKLEKAVKQKFNILKSETNTSGDGIINNKKIEIKVSLGDMKGQLNFVQIRPGHDIDFYLFLGFNLFEYTNNLEIGKIYWFLIPSKQLYNLLPEYGGYAHGTLIKNGKITLENISKHKSLEYCLRPNPTKLKSKCRTLWDKLMAYNRSENEIMDFLNDKN